MKVAVFSESYYQVNGIARTYQNMMEYARSKDLDLDIYTNGDEKVDRQGSVTIYSIKPSLPLNIYPGLVFDVFSVPRRILGRLPPIVFSNFRERDYDLVIIATQGTMGIYGLTAAKKFNVATVGSYHTQIPFYAKLRAQRLLGPLKKPLFFIPRIVEELTWIMEARFYKRTIFNLAPTRAIGSPIKERFKVPSRTFRRGVDTEKFDPSRGRKKDGKTVLYVSRLAVEKNIEILEGFGKELPDARLVFVGDGPDRKILERRIPEAEFKGFKTGEPLWEEYASADVFIFPSITETYGNVVQEAMASGVPAVVDAGGPTSELVENGVTGFHYGSREEMFARLKSIIEDDELRSEMSSNARKAMLERTWECVFDDLYQDLKEAARLHMNRRNVKPRITRDRSKEQPA